MTKRKWYAQINDPKNVQSFHPMALVISPGIRRAIDCTGSGENYAEDCENAKLIVRAVNAHDDLLAFIKRVAYEPIGEPEASFREVYDMIVEEAKALHAKAERP